MLWTHHRCTVEWQTSWSHSHKEAPFRKCHLTSTQCPNRLPKIKRCAKVTWAASKSRSNSTRPGSKTCSFNAVNSTTASCQMSRKRVKWRGISITPWRQTSKGIYRRYLDSLQCWTRTTNTHTIARCSTRRHQPTPNQCREKAQLT